MLLLSVNVAYILLFLTRKWLHYFDLLGRNASGRSRVGVGAEVGVDIFIPESELESESPRICRFRSPGVEKSVGVS